MSEEIPLIPRGNHKKHHKHTRVGAQFVIGKGRSRGRGNLGAFAVGVGSYLAQNPGLLQYFANANPPFASTSVYNSLRMARRRVVRTQVRRRRRKATRRSNFKGRNRRRRVIRRVKAVVRNKFYLDYDGSTGEDDSKLVNTLSNKGGVRKIVINTKKFHDDDSIYTHFKILKVKIRLIPEEHAPYTAAEVMKNKDRTVPSCFKTWHMGTTVPDTIAKMMKVQGCKPFDPHRMQTFVFRPKYLLKVTSAVAISQRPRNLWLPKDTAISPLNGPVLMWSKYNVPDDGQSNQSYRFKIVISALIAYKRFSSLGGSVGAAAPSNFVLPVTVGGVGGVASLHV